MAFPKRRNLQDLPRKKLVVVGSQNPVKVSCAEEAFHLAFDDQFVVQGLNVSSGVSEQPFGDAETYQGAYNRAHQCQLAFPEADFWVGIEGGVDEWGEDMAAFAWIVVLDRQGKVGRAKTAAFSLPPGIKALVRDGVELGEANDQSFQKLSAEQRGGAIGSLSNGRVSRRALYKQAALLALIPFIQDEHY